MDIKMEIIFSDGSTLNVTEQQLKELRSYKINKGNKQSIDNYKTRILKHLKNNNGKSTIARTVNALRLYNNIEVCDLAIKFLIDDGIIKMTESTNKYNKAVSKIITLI